MSKIFVKTDQDVVKELLGDDLGQAIIRPDHDEKIIGFQERWSEACINNNLTGGLEYVDGSVVPVGEIWVITSIAIQYAGTVPNSMWVLVMDGMGNPYQLYEKNVVSTTMYFSLPYELLETGDYLRLAINVATAGDKGRMWYGGWKMKSP